MRKLIRRHLPRPDKLREQPVFALLGRSLLHPRLWHLNRHSAAGGLAAGVFCSLIPGPLQMLGAALLCIIFRVNLPLALVGTLLSNPLTIVPLYLLAFLIGRFILRSDAHFVTPPDFTWNALSEAIHAYWQWSLELGYPLVVGLPLLAILLAGASYFSVKFTWQWYLLREVRRRKLRTKNRDPNQQGSNPNCK